MACDLKDSTPNDLKARFVFLPRQEFKVFNEMASNISAMESVTELSRWLVSGVFWLIAMVLSLILLIVIVSLDSIFLQNSNLALIPVTFQVMMCVSVIAYLTKKGK